MTRNGFFGTNTYNKHNYIKNKNITEPDDLVGLNYNKNFKSLLIESNPFYDTLTGKTIDDEKVVIATAIRPIELY